MTGARSAASPLIEVDAVDVVLGGRSVLAGVDLVIGPGELVGLLGPNGAGKTTLLRAVLGLLRPAAGQVRVEGRTAKPGRVSIGYVPQRHEFAWDFPLSVSHAVMTGLTRQLGWWRRPGVAAWEAVADALALVQMSDFADRPVGQLSGGQRQRVLLARALSLRPSVLLLDEPYTGLDMPTQEMLADLLRELAAEGRAVLMTTHDILAALDGCDRIALLNRRVVADGPPAQVAADADSWMGAYGVGPDSTLVRLLKAA